jgi:hypothetical protein
MEARVARLESDMEHVKKGVDGIQKTLSDFRIDAMKSFGAADVKLSTLDERTKHMPTRWETFLIVASVLAALGTAVGIAAHFIP